MAIQYSIQKMVSDGTLSTIALGIQYLQRNDIYMRIAGEETPQSGAPSGYTWSFVNNTTLKILPAVPNGVEVVVYRRTDIDAMYNIYSQNAQFDEATIDENNQQLLYIAQEYLEQGIPGAGVDTIEFVRDDGTYTYYRIKRTDGSYSDEFTVPSAGSATKIFAREALRRSYAEAGYVLVAGSFEAGATANNAADVVLFEAEGKAYSWGGTLPKTVPAGSTPASSGGLGAAAWIDKSPTTFDVLVESFRASNPTDSGCIQAAINSTSKGTIKLQPGRTYNLTSDVTFLSKNPGNPSGTLTLDATGAVVTGTGNLIIDSCKYLRLVGVQMPNQDVVVNGMWFSSLESCVFRNLILSQEAGTSFSASYWNSLKDCNFQSIVKYAVGINAHNEFTFYSCRLRGNAQQGFAGTADYAINLIGNSNTQSWKFYGGDISYHNLGIYNIDPSNTNDVELMFDGVYFDTLLPQLSDRARTTIRTKNCHNAIGIGAKAPLKTKFSAIVGNITDIFSASRSFRFTGSMPKNLIPGGDLRNDLGVWNGNGKPVNNAPAGTVFTSTTGGFSGNILQVNTLGAAGVVYFKSQALTAPGKMTGCIILKNAVPGEDTVQISFNGLFEGQITISDQYWTAYSLTSEAMVAVSSGVTLTVSKSPSAPLNFLVGYVGIFYGTDTPILAASDGFTTIELRDTGWDLSAGIPANSQVEKVFSVPGATFGDFVLHASETSSTNLKKVIFSARVTAADTVTVTATNPTSSAITNLSATTITNLRVWKLKLFF